VALATAAGALLVVPTIGQADPPVAGTPHAHGKAKGKAKSCAQQPTVKKGFVVKGTLVSYTADDPITLADNETSVTITVTGANRHARVSGELGLDRDPNKKGVQVAGATYTTDADDSYTVQLSGYEGGPTDVPAAGDKVRIVGKIPVTKKRCAAAGTSTADRFGEEDIRRVKIIDDTPDAVVPPVL